MATSPLKIASNRANAEKSTGPRTADGKRASSLNAIRHGLTAQIVVLPSEDMEAYCAFTAGFAEDLHPEGVLETQLAQTLADTQWRANRCRALEAALFALGHHRNAPKLDLGKGPHAQAIQTALAAAQSLADNIGTLKVLSMHEQRLNRAFHSTLKQFHECQTLRRQQVEQELQQAIRIRSYLKTKGREFHPAEFGFVSSKSQLEIAMRKQAALHGRFYPENSPHPIPLTFSSPK